MEGRSLSNNQVYGYGIVALLLVQKNWQVSKSARNMFLRKGAYKAGRLASGQVTPWLGVKAQGKVRWRVAALGPQNSVVLGH